MWVHVFESDLRDGQHDLVPAGAVLEDEGVYALGSVALPTRPDDGVVPIPGRNPLKPARASSWATGVVTEIRDQGADRTHVGQEFLLVAGQTRLIGRTWERRRDRLQLGDRVTLACWFELVAGSDWSVFELPEHWSGPWRVREVRDGRGRNGDADLALDLEPVVAPPAVPG